MPIMSCSIYTVTQDLELPELSARLADVNIEEQRDVYGETFTLHTITSDIQLSPDREILSGNLSFENLQPLPQLDGTTNFTPVGARATFYMFYGEVSLYLVLFARRSFAESSANKINFILTRNEDVPHQIVFNFFIETDKIEDFLAQHPHTKKYVGWKDLNYPGVNTSSLHGANVDSFQHAQEYDRHGRKSYVLIELVGDGVVRISSKGVVTFFSNITVPNALRWIRDEIVS
jgi:hypothetical protein